MIFVCVGTKRFPFDRLLKEIDFLLENEFITENVFAQIGSTEYEPSNYNYSQYLSEEEFKDKLDKAEIVITHGGTGAIIKALKAQKQVIVVPRLQKYGEHSDDHQIQIVEQFSESNLVRSSKDIRDLKDLIYSVKKYPIRKQFSSSGNIVDVIDNFIKKSL